MSCGELRDDAAAASAYLGFSSVVAAVLLAGVLCLLLRPRPPRSLRHGVLAALTAALAPLPAAVVVGAYVAGRTADAHPCGNDVHLDVGSGADPYFAVLLVVLVVVPLGSTAALLCSAWRQWYRPA